MNYTHLDDMAMNGATLWQEACVKDP